MTEIFLGEYIKQRRLELGLTQEQVCEGICEPITMSRIENGKHPPSRSRVNAILQRLGLPEDRYFLLLSNQEKDIVAMQEAVISCHERSKTAREPEAAQLLAEARENIQELERISERGDQLTYQFILYYKALLGTSECAFSPAQRLDMLLEALRLSAPRFDLDDINRSLYGPEEIRIILQIGAAYADAGQLQMAAGIFSQLLDYLQNHTPRVLQSDELLPPAACHYAKALAVGARYEEAIEAAQLGRQSILKYGHYLCLPELLHVLAQCYHFLGNREESLNFYNQAYCVYLATGNDALCETLRAEVWEYDGYKFRFERI